jgi:hypothetical protein
MDEANPEGDGGGGAAGDILGDGGSGAASTASAEGDGGLDWGKVKDALPEDLRNDPGLSTITSLENLAKGYVNIQKTMGNKVAVPDKHATTDDWKGVFQKLGNPEKIEDYKLNLEGEFDENFLKGITEVAHKAGVLPWQMEQLLKGYNDIASEVMGADETARQAQKEKDIEELKKEWGQAFDTQKAKVNVALKELLPNEADRQRLADDGLASHPSVVRMLANAAKFFNEDTFVGHGEGKLAGVTPEEALKKANDIIGAGPEHPYRNAAHPNHAQAQKEVQDLFEIAYPGS